jgi:hypothetical protein
MVAGLASWLCVFDRPSFLGQWLKANSQGSSRCHSVDFHDKQTGSLISKLRTGLQLSKKPNVEG